MNVCRYLLFICDCLTCTYTSLNFLYLDVPEAPLNAKAIVPLTAIFESDCDIIVRWDPPANSVDITHYMVYVPALNVDATTNFLITSLLLRNCPERFGIKIAAINRFGCIGIISSEVNVTLPSTSESSKYIILYYIIYMKLHVTT